MKIVTLIIVLVFCVFIGVLGISLGLGTVVPAVNQIAQPVFCPNGKMVSETQSRQGFKRSTIIEATWFCQDNSTQEKTPINMFQLYMLVGSGYGLVLFIIIFLLMLMARKGRAIRMAQGKG